MKKILVISIALVLAFALEANAQPKVKVAFEIIDNTQKFSDQITQSLTQVLNERGYEIVSKDAQYLIRAKLAFETTEDKDSVDVAFYINVFEAKKGEPSIFLSISIWKVNTSGDMEKTIRDIVRSTFLNRPGSQPASNTKAKASGDWGPQKKGEKP